MQEGHNEIHSPMSIIIALSLSIRLLALVWSLNLILTQRHRYLVFFGAMIALMALRQSLTLFGSDNYFPLEFSSNLDEVPGLAVSILALVGLIAIKKTIDLERGRAQSLQKEISEREIAERSRDESAEDFRQLAESSIQGIVITTFELRPQFLNDEFARIFGYESKELVLSLPDIESLIPPHEILILDSLRTPRPMENKNTDQVHLRRL